MIMKLLKSIFAALAVILCVSSAQAALPSVKLKDLKGKTVDMAQLNNGGKPIIISFFASWCKPCKRELNAISEYYPDWVDETGVKLIAISVDKAQETSKVKGYVDSQGWEYDILLDPNSDFMRAMGIQQIPHLLIIDGTGKIVESRSGYTDGSEGHIIKKLREITKNKPAAKKASAKKK